MSELLRYEEVIKEQFSDLALPDENFAWTEMKKLLDDEEERRPILLPWRPGCGPIILLLVLLTGLAWYFLHPEKWFTSHTEKTNKTTQIIQQQDPIKKQDDKPSTNNDITNPTGTNDNDKPGTTSLTDKKNYSDRNNNLTNATDTLTSDNTTVQNNRQIPLKRSPENPQKEKTYNKRKASSNNLTKNTSLPPRRGPGGDHNKNSNTSTSVTSEEDNTVNQATTPSSTNDNTAINTPTRQPNETLKDSIPTKKPLTINKPDSTKKDSTKPKPEESSTYSWGAGLGLNQQIALGGGQKAVTYGSLGRKGDLKDYIPSLYFRFYKDKKWFVQAELRYGAPQYTKNITYSSEKNAANNLETNLVLKKTYYHQLPVGFNYYVLPGLSLGSGFVWNKFSSAVSEQVVQRPAVTGQPDSVVSKSVVKTKTRNKVFSKSFFQWMTEFQYTYKRKYTLGARYALGLQPYIKFQLPNEPLKEEKNSSLQVFFKYEFWNKKKKEKK